MQDTEVALAPGSEPDTDAPSAGSTQLTVQACQREWRLQRAADIESLWNSMTDFATDDERLPYWAELWPSSLVLADWLQARQAHISGQRCLDIGCGIGFTALVGQWLGARVMGMDYEVQALRHARCNAALNAVPQPDWLAMDWRFPALAAGSVDVAWGGDIMYERRFATPLADFVHRVLRPHGVMWLAEPNRSVYDSFAAAVTARGMSMTCVHRAQTAAVIPQERPVPVRVWQIAR